MQNGPEEEENQTFARLGKKHANFLSFNGSCMNMVKYTAALKQKYYAWYWQPAKIALHAHSHVATFTSALSCCLQNVTRLHTREEKEHGMLNRPTGPSDYQVLNSYRSAQSPSSDLSAVHAGPAAC